MDQKTEACSRDGDSSQHACARAHCPACPGSEGGGPAVHTLSNRSVHGIMHTVGMQTSGAGSVSEHSGG